MNKVIPCPLCQVQETSELGSPSAHRQFYICHHCDLRFLRPDLRLSASEERARYSLHQNSIEDKGYKQFVSPLLQEIKDKIKPHSRGLDFGCGPTPTLSHFLQNEGFTMDLFDPIFNNDLQNIKSGYDFIVCCEVIEHFYCPNKELELLRSKLAPHGVLFVMTQLWQDQLRFNEWYYQRDPTHVCFYSEQTFKWIQNRWQFKSLEIQGSNLIMLSI